MRVVKDANERRNEILDVAEELFGTKGFDNTSTNDILERVKIARGTLYYHFKSKEDILDAVIDRMAVVGMNKAAAVVNNKSIPVLERLTLSIMALNIESGAAEEVMHQMHKPQNALMHQKLQQNLLDGMVPIIAELVKEGIEEGIFNTEYPREAAEMALLYSNIAFDDLNELTPDVMLAKMQAFIYHTERILGASKGSMQDAIMKIYLKK